MSGRTNLKIWLAMAVFLLALHAGAGLSSGRPYSEVAKLLASDAAAEDWFGWSVALSGTTALVGAYGNDAAGTESGSAYLCDFSDPCNIIETKLTASDAAAGDNFGYSVALSGTTALVGVPFDDDSGIDSGSAYLYDFSDPWNIIETKLTASNAATSDFFGVSVAIRGTTALVGAPFDDDAGTDSGSAYLYDFSDPCNITEIKLTASDADVHDRFGWSVALSGTTALVGALFDDDAGSMSGSAYLYDFSDPCNITEIKLTASASAAGDWFGWSVAISGTTALVGVPFDDGSGSAYLYDFSDPCNIIETMLTASDAATGDQFGGSVALSGTTALVGAHLDGDAGTESGSAYLFDFSDPCNITETKLTACDAAAHDRFGLSVALSGTTALVGAWGNDDAGSDSGSAYLFRPPVMAALFVDADATGANDGTSWANAYNYLQDALDDAQSGDEIWVAEGVYRPDEDESGNVTPGDREATFQLVNGVEIYGGFPSVGDPNWNERDPNTYETILSGDMAGDDEPNFVNNEENSYHVVTGSGTDETTVLDGFTIAGGNASGDWLDILGGGMYNELGSPTVMNCTFGGNSAGWGGAMFNQDSSPTLINCTFTGNSNGDFGSGGGMYNTGGSPMLTNCTFIGNSAGHAGGMTNYQSSPTLTNCTFSGNSAGYSGGGMGNLVSNPTLTNCTFSGNSAYYWAGGMYNNYSSPTLTNCTFSENSADDFGGGMYNSSSSPTVTNCILWANTASSGSQIYDDGTSSATVSYSDVQGGWGSGNINADPCFVDANGADDIPGTADDNLNVSDGSPCIDTGDNNSVPADTADLDGDGNTTELIPWDLDGNQRIVDGDKDGNPVVDMGAFEYFVTAPVANAGPNQVVCAWIDGIADVVLDGNDSYDPDGDEITYLWSWTIGPNTYDTNGVSPIIELPIGTHTIQLIVNDGLVDSEPNEVVITVVEPMESHLWIFPKVIQRYGRLRKVVAWVRLPEGITRDQIDRDKMLMLYPVGSEEGIEATFQLVCQRRRCRPPRTSVVAFFDKDELMEVVPDDGWVVLQAVGQFVDTGQYFYGCDTIRIKGWRWPWWRRWWRWHRR